MPLTLLSRAEFEGLTVDDLQTHLNITDTTQQVYIASLMEAAIQYCERYVDMDLRTSQWKLTLETFPIWSMYGNYQYSVLSDLPFDNTSYTRPYGWLRMQRIDLLRGTLVSVDEVQYYDVGNNSQTLTENTDYRVLKPTYQHGIIEPITWWLPSYPRIDSVNITFTTAMCPVPEQINQAIRLLVGMWYSNREAMAYGASTVVSYNERAVHCLLDSIKPAFYR